MLLHPCLFCMCSVQNFNQVQLCPPSSLASSQRPRVAHRFGLCHRSPPSNGKTVILSITDRFSKSAHFLVLPKLPSSRETTDLLVDNGFPWTALRLCLTEALSLHCKSGKPSVLPWEPLPAFLADTILRQTTKQRGHRRWRLCSTVSPPLIHPPGAPCFSGWNTCITPC